MSVRRLLLVSVGIVAALVASSGDADACGALPADPATCTDGLHVPNDQIPSNLGLMWFPSYAMSEIAQANASLVREDSGQAVPYTLKQTKGGAVWIVPDAELTSGARYTFARTATCRQGGTVSRKVSSTFTATAPIAAGKSFGGAPVASVPVDKTVRVGSGGCVVVETHDVNVRSAIVTPAADAPIRAALPYTNIYYARIDGNVDRSYGTRSGDGIELQAYCSGDAAQSPITPGVHTVQLYATYPGSSDGVVSDPVQVDFSCGGGGGAAAADEPPSSGCNAGGTRTGAAGALVFGLAMAVAARLRSRRKR